MTQSCRDKLALKQKLTFNKTNKTIKLSQEVEIKIYFNLLNDNAQPWKNVI